MPYMAGLMSHVYAHSCFARFLSVSRGFENKYLLGRVTDDKDRRCILAILSNYYNESALSTGYSFAPGGYEVLVEGSHEDYLNHIKKLPFLSSPEVFGLHENAAITKDLKETRELFEAMSPTCGLVASVASRRPCHHVGEGLVTQVEGYGGVES